MIKWFTFNKDMKMDYTFPEKRNLTSYALPGNLEIMSDTFLITLRC